jgi:hypothetical protein
MEPGLPIRNGRRSSIGCTDADLQYLFAVGATSTLPSGCEALPHPILAAPVRLWKPRRRPAHRAALSSLERDAQQALAQALANLTEEQRQALAGLLGGRQLRGTAKTLQAA